MDEAGGVAPAKEKSDAGSALHSPSAAACAFSAVRSEIRSLRLKDPYEVDVTAVLHNSLRYPVYSDRLDWETVRMDAGGVPRAWTRTTGVNYWPAVIAWYGLVRLGDYHRSKAPRHMDAFLNQLGWLERNAVVREDGAVVWQNNFDYPEDGIVLRAPWVSAHSQGLVISAVVRGWRITKKPRLLSLLEGSSRIFDLDASRGGIRAQVEENVFYTEVPGGSLPGILDGFLVALIGLHDLRVETGDANVERQLADGIEGLRKLLPWWNYQDKWSWYGRRLYLCPPLYHHWNRALLSVIGGFAGCADLTELAERWNPVRLSGVERAWIHFAFLATKNWARIRHATWVQKTVR